MIYVTFSNCVTGYSTFTHAGSVVMTNAVFILANVFFTFVDLTARPAFMLQYKIQEDKNVPVR